MEPQRKLYYDHEAFLGLLKKRGIRDEAVLKAMAIVPREQFVGIDLAQRQNRPDTPAGAACGAD